ncbi:hypothetical protein JTE90_008683 [Oedothorax gibbosus]|uniref:DUF38 domain-containing protein n=1 Tax=Oedothorax gibbosus TaxID=931172 RepID=A0AAV6TFT4_9ARAC|nr:hypothetical protein JTE90_008683 [Oedothorax gibbosus]
MVFLDTKDSAMVNLLRKYPSCMRSELTYCYYKSDPPTFFKIEDFQIIKDIWKMHTDFRSIEITTHNVIFIRFAPKKLMSLCIASIDNGEFDRSPAHVVERLKCVVEDSDDDVPSEEEVGKCFKFTKI